MPALKKKFGLSRWTMSLLEHSCIS